MRNGKIENLKPQSKRTKGEQREVAKKGGKKSGEVRKEKKNFQQACRWFLEIKDKETGLTNLERIVMTQGDKALNGELSSAVFIRDTAGEKPADKIDNLNPTTIINNNTLSIEKLKELKNKLGI